MPVVNELGRQDDRDELWSRDRGGVQRSASSTTAPGARVQEPFFVARDGPTFTRRLLLLSYHFPPDQAIGALRWQRLAAYAAERRWGIDAFTLPPDSMASTDESRLDELPAGARVFGVPVPVAPVEAVQFAVWRAIRPLVRRQDARGEEEPAHEPAATGQNAATISHPLVRAHLARMEYSRLGRWARNVANAARFVADPGIHRVVISSGPPHMVHEAGRLLAAQIRVPFVMDMRDPWFSPDVMPPELESEAWLRLARRHERRCVRAATLVVVNTETARRALAASYPPIADRFVTVMNGADPEEIPVVPRGRRFSIRFAGNLYVGRDPSVLFRAVGEVARKLSLSPDDIGVDFIGGEMFGGESVVAMAENLGVAPYFTWGPPRPRSEALEFLAGGCMLVNLPQHVHASIPAKVFEYVQYEAWLLVLAEPGSATATLFEGTSADVVHPHDAASVARVIEQRFLEHRAGVTPRALNADGRFSRRRQAEILLDHLERWR